MNEPQNTEALRKCFAFATACEKGIKSDVPSLDEFDSAMLNVAALKRVSIAELLQKRDPEVHRLYLAREHARMLHETAKHAENIAISCGVAKAKSPMSACDVSSIDEELGQLARLNAKPGESVELSMGRQIREGGRARELAQQRSAILARRGQ